MIPKHNSEIMKRNSGITYFRVYLVKVPFCGKPTNNHILKKYVMW